MKSEPVNLALWRGNDLELRLAIVGADGKVIEDISAIDTLTIDLCSDRIEGAARVLSRDATLTQHLSQADWDSRAGQHGLVRFTFSEMALNLGQAPEGEFWLVAHYLTNDDPPIRRTAFGRWVTLFDDGTTGPLSDSRYGGPGRSNRFEELVLGDYSADGVLLGYLRYRSVNGLLTLVEAET